MVDIISFIFFKMVAIICLVIVWGWPPFVAWVVWIVAHHEDYGWTEKFWKTSAIVVGALGSITYWNSIWPAPEGQGDRVGTDSLYYFALRGYKEQAVINEADRPPVRTNLGTEIRRYRLNAWNPPKHFYVDITDTTTGENFGRLYVSKHCNAASSLKKGEEYNIPLNKYTLSNSPDTVRYEFTNLSTIFC